MIFSPCLSTWLSSYFFWRRFQKKCVLLNSSCNGLQRQPVEVRKQHFPFIKRNQQNTEKSLCIKIRKGNNGTTRLASLPKRITIMFLRSSAGSVRGLRDADAEIEVWVASLTLLHRSGGMLCVRGPGCPMLILSICSPFGLQLPCHSVIRSIPGLAGPSVPLRGSTVDRQMTKE